MYMYFYKIIGGRIDSEVKKSLSTVGHMNNVDCMCRIGANTQKYNKKKLKLYTDACFVFSGQDLLQLLPVVGTLTLLAYITYQAFKPKPAPKNTKCNLRIQKESSKVVNMVDIEDLADKVSYCRCWRSKKVHIVHFETPAFSY